MKFVDEFRDAAAVKKILPRIHGVTTQPWNIMEICGGQTHAFLRYGIDKLLPEEITLLHGPGCPVCVTPLQQIDKALQLAAMENVIFCSFGDMVRVPGSREDLLSVKARGGDVRIVYSPIDALKIAMTHPDKDVVFFAIGFETTAPANAMVILQAEAKKQRNFTALCSQVVAPAAMETILASPTNKVDGFLAAGHVCSVMGYHEYIPLAEKYKIPIVVTGFEPLDLLCGVFACVKQLQEQRYGVENQYRRSVTRAGNIPAQETMKKVFHLVDWPWRGIGMIPRSGLVLRDEYAEYDAEKRFQLHDIEVQESKECIAGLILQGVKKPLDCSHFGTACTPDHPLGATMVSSEGACAGYFEYKR
ncbi:hydrogenase formation protein HypD [candidate division KSB1 bacterium]|nr:hydrogenase formation protein HypD [candidate division KSB1 bacterium]RQW05461.1 MAG: hydrogenase formation protein HypD [candidate division KSB1 bacterium]